MILSDKTAEILTNFSSINPSMVLDWDGSLCTVSPQGNIIAIAEVPERYPFPWHIFDVPQMLGIIKLMDASTAIAETYSDHVLFKQPNSTVQYRFTEPALIKTMADKTKAAVRGVSLEAEIQYKELQQLIKAASMLRNTHIKLEQSDELLVLKSYNLNNSAVSNYNLSIPIKALSEEFSFEPCSFKIEHFNLLKSDYQLKVAAKCLYLENPDNTIKYWIGKEK